MANWWDSFKEKFLGTPKRSHFASHPSIPTLPPEIVARLRELNITSSEDLENLWDEHPDLAQAVQRAMLEQSSELYAFNAFMEAHSPQELLNVILLYPSLLEDETIQTIGKMIADARSKNRKGLATILEKRQALLLALRTRVLASQDEGQPERLEVTKGRTNSRPSLGPLLAEMAHSISQSDWPRIVELCNQSLLICRREENPLQWAALQGQLADALSQTPIGERAENLERAIDCYEKALQVLTRERFPEPWASTLDSLGTTYAERIRGERAMNLERAIECYNLALQIRTYNRFPVQWAGTMDNLGNAYMERICGERAENLECALDYHKQSLRFRTREQFPERWAKTQSNLGFTYVRRIRGEKADNIDHAIDHFNQALSVLTRKQFPQEWAETTHNLASAYAERIQGERAENLESAIEYYEQALQVLTREHFPERWAETLMALANALSVRIMGQRATNLERAISFYDQVLHVLAWEQFPEKWAMAQYNLGIAYADRLQGEHSDNLQRAIKCYALAIRVYTREQFPHEWASIQNSLGLVYVRQAQNGLKGSIELAVPCFNRALQVYTREQFPERWSMMQHNLGNAFVFRVQGEREENVNQAIQCYESALQIQTRQSMPLDHLKTQRSLGNLLFIEHHWSDALNAFADAIETGDVLLSSAFSEGGRRAEIAETSRLYIHAAYCLLQLNRPAVAIEQLEQGKTRLLTQALALAEADSISLSVGHKDTLRTKLQTIRELEAEMRLPQEMPAKRSDRDLAELLRVARSELDALVVEIRKEHPDFMPLGLTLPEILALIPEDGALVAPIITSQGSAVFIVPHGAQTVNASCVIMLDDFKDESLTALMVGTEDNPGWIRAYITHRATSEWQSDVDRITAQMWDTIVVQIHARLQTLGVKRVALMPSGGLQLLPLHAAWRLENGIKRYWVDDYEISYAPSAYALRASQKRASERTGQTALIAGVSEYKQFSQLHYARAEAEEVSKLFNAQPLMNNMATPNAIMQGVRGAAYLHLSCHGSFAWGEDALASALYLADDVPLTLGDILGKMDLNAARLVTLSACETGMTDVRQSPDEYVGLPAGFLQAGAAGVVSSLWSVDDMSTALLMIRFYGNHLKEKQSPAEALRNAQLWLREVTNAELADLFAEYKMNASDTTTRMAYATAQEKFREHTLAEPNAKPFEHPYYWAAFAMYGT